ncbi:hypothetical protein [Streptomyces sp. PTD5-9]|uniref:hypothetical protein n=1 Tax=Streptomyces sp. PTD5-9 TaxID=3120150 RepID=UPI00300A790E
MSWPSGAGGSGEFHRERCGREARRHLRGVCGNCVPAERSEEFLDDDAGRVRPELVPFFEEARSVPRPKATLTWVAKPEEKRLESNHSKPDAYENFVKYLLELPGSDQ